MLTRDEYDALSRDDKLIAVGDAWAELYGEHQVSMMMRFAALDGIPGVEEAPRMKTMWEYTELGFGYDLIEYAESFK